MSLTTNLLTDKISLAQGARLLPSLTRGRPVSPATLWRWAKYGSRAADGTLVRLQTWRIGGRCVTSADAIQSFVAALSGTADPGQAVAATRTAEAVERELDAAGIR